MTDERFNHLEAQITELREFVRQSTTAMQDNIASIQQNAIVMQQDLNALHEDMTALCARVDLIEGTVTSEIRKGFNSLRNHLDDLSVEKSTHHRNTSDEDLNQHKLNRRIPTFDKREDD